MPSNEEKNRNGNAEAESYGIDAVTELSAEEIEKLLAESTGAGFEEQAEDDFQGDVLEMLEKAEDDDLSDIQDMLQKSDRNEAIDAAEETDSQPSPADELLADIERASEEPEKPLDAKARKAQEKLRKAQEKAEKNEKKKAEKEAARAEKAKKRKSKKRGAGHSEKEPLELGGLGEDSGGIEEFDLLQDRELLDSIVSDAGKLGNEDSSSQGGFSVNQLEEEVDAALERRDALESERIKDRDVMPEKETEAESSIMELDMDEIDAFIPDISSGPKEEPKKKSGFFSKIITMLTEEEPENEDIPISEENQEILRDLDQEKSAKGKKAKKAKKPAKKKEKKKKPPKPAKPKKPKKVKESEPYAPGRKITFKKALPILLLGATIGAVTFIFVNLAGDYSVKQEAEEAYRNGDYGTCYLNLYGRKLSEEQEQMYGKSESILYMEQEYRKYDIVLKNGTEVQALDSLLQTVNAYPEIYEYAAQCDALPEVEEIYGRIIGILSDKYGITQEQAMEIAALESRIEYTRAVTAVAEGKGYGSGSAPEEPEEDSETQTGPEGQPEEGTEGLPDELPEEAELDDGSFVDN